MGYICYICRMIRKALFALMFFAQVFFVQAQDSLKIGTAHLAYDVRDYSFFISVHRLSLERVLWVRWA